MEGRYYSGKSWSLTNKGMFSLHLIVEVILLGGGKLCYSLFLADEGDSVSSEFSESQAMEQRCRPAEQSASAGCSGGAVM